MKRKNKQSEKVSSKKNKKNDDLPVSSSKSAVNQPIPLLSNNVILPDDIYYEMIKFLDTPDIIHNCSLVSKQWNEIVTSRIKLSVEILNETQWNVLSSLKKEFLNNIERLYICKMAAIEIAPKCIEKIHEFKGLREFSLANAEIDDKLIEKLSSLSQLTSLDISLNNITEKGIRFIGERMNNLQELNILGNREIGLKGVEHLKRLTNLKKLNCYGCEMGLSSLDQLSGLKQLISLTMDLYNATLSNSFTQLETLIILQGEITAEKVKPIVSMNSLTNLEISSDNLGNGAIPYIASLTGLKSLSLSGNIGCEGVEQISRSLKNLTKLNIGNNPILNKGLNTILSMTQLRDLNIEQIPLKDYDFSKKIKAMKNLTSLNITGCNIKGKSELTAIASLPLLKALNVQSTEIGGDETLIISKMKNLQNLNISENEIRNYGAQQLSKMINLTELNVESCDIDNNGMKSLMKLENLTNLNVDRNETNEACVEYILKMKNLKYLSITFRNNEKMKETLMKGLVHLRMWEYLGDYDSEDDSDGFGEFDEDDLGDNDSDDEF